MEKREIECTGAHPPCIMLNSKGLVTEWEESGPRVDRCSAQRGCTFTDRKIQSTESTGEKSWLMEHPQRVPSSSLFLF